MDESHKAEAYSALKEELDGGEVGYYLLPEDISLVANIESYILEKNLASDRIENVVILGIGGSSLGTKAIDRLLEYSTKRDENAIRRRNNKNLIFLENVDPNEIEESLKGVRVDNSVFIVISKSGGTIETTSSFKFLLKRFGLTFDDEVFQNSFIIITDKNSPLDQFANDFNLKVFHLPTNVGGRFSVLSAVGLLPLALVGYDIGEILAGAKELKESFFAKKEDMLIKKAYYYAINREKTPINVLFSYSSAFKFFNEWFVQLWAESLGKINRDGEHVGLTPVGLIGSIDQHSFLQLIIEGPKDKNVTMIKVKNFDNDLMIPDITLPHLEKTDFINNHTFNELINAQCDATMQSILDQDIGLDRIVIDRLTEKSVGYLILYFELLTSLTGYFLNLNTYDQPGVELGKKILQERFSK
ncbi:MAG: glucose-6-phosphate isomerase [Sulfurospirillum sp.]|nr:MAG: glucose-6-phosphate isomerase [Sulfurospirillum sp.]